MSIRQDWLQSEAAGVLTSGGMGALYRWFSALAPADKLLIEHFIVRPGSIPVLDVDPDEEEEAGPVEVEEPRPVTTRKAHFEYECQKCHTVWSWPMAWCAECGNGFEEAA